MLASVYAKSIRDRWVGVAVGVGAIGLWLLMGVAVYRDIDLDVYRDLPELMRSLMGIPEGADVAALAVGVIFGFAGAMILASLALSIGAGSIAGEERDGTMGLLLANPRTRRHILVSKAGGMVTVITAGTLALFGATLTIPSMLGVSVGEMHVAAMMVHLLFNALFYGMLALLIGAWTGDRTRASGITAGVMILGYFAVGLLPLIQGASGLARLFPWYYLDGADPANNGVAWAHIALLGGCSIAFLGAAGYLLDRRDIRDTSQRVTVVDRLRAHPTTRKVVDRLAGSTRVSRIWIKTFSEHQGLLIVTAYVMFLMMGVMMGPMFNAIEEPLRTMTENAPEALMALVGNADMGTPEGWYQGETFSIMAPVAVALMTVTVGARALAGEEANRTMGLLLANPIRRSTIVLEKTVAMVVSAVVVGIFTWIGVVLGSMLGGLGMSWANIAAICVLVTLLGLVIGSFALLLSAATGRVKIAVYGTVGVATASYLIESFLPLSDSLAGYARWTPFHYYLSSDPLGRGLDWAHVGILAGLTAALVAAAVVLFQRRDIRQAG